MKEKKNKIKQFANDTNTIYSDLKLFDIPHKKKKFKRKMASVNEKVVTENA